MDFRIFLIVFVYAIKPYCALKDVLFNRICDGYTFRNIQGISLPECWSNCEQRPSCWSINYRRNSNICQLNSAAETFKTQAGVVFKTKANPKDNVDCGSNTCNKDMVCDIKTKECKMKECKHPKETERVSIRGNMASVRSEKLFSCKEGFRPTAGNRFSVMAECELNGWKNTVECVPLTCKGLADVGEKSSAIYKSYDESSQMVIDIHCDFYDEIGYTYFIPGTMDLTINISSYYTREDHVMLRHVRDGQQYESKMEVLPAYGDTYNVSIFNSEHTDFNQPKSAVIKPYLYMSFVPNSYGIHQGKVLGYSCNGQDFTFTNSDNNKNNYFAIYETMANVVRCWPGGSVADGWIQCSKPVDSTRNLPDAVFFNKYEIHMGGGGCLVQNCQLFGVSGLALITDFHLPFRLS